MPTRASRPFSETDFTDDLARFDVPTLVLHSVMGGIGTPVLLVAHSYGGIVMTEAATGSDAVVGLVYVNEFAPDHDESAFQLSTMFPGSGLADALVAYPVATGGNELAIRRELFHHPFAADVPASQAALMGATPRPVTQAASPRGCPPTRRRGSTPRRGSCSAT